MGDSSSVTAGKGAFLGRLLEHGWGAAGGICPFRDLAVGFHGGDLPGGSRSRWDLLCLRIQCWCSMGLRNQETPGAGFATFRDAELGFLGGELSGDSWSMTGLGFATFRDAALGFHGVEDPPGSWSMEQVEFVTFRNAALGFHGGKVLGGSWSLAGVRFATFRDAAVVFHGVEEAEGSWSRWDLPRLGMQQCCDKAASWAWEGGGFGEISLKSLCMTPADS